VYTWVVNDQAELDFVLSLGVDYVATDRPADLRDLLEARHGAAAGPRPGV
jgi:glycerophosphoryl diester phosphodiesterase